VIQTVPMTLPQWVKWTVMLPDRIMEAAHRGVLSGALRCLPVMQDSTREAAPATIGSPRGAVDKGHYLQAWRAVAIPRGSRVYNAAIYSPIVEGGRRPSYVGQAGIRNLAGWVRRNLKTPRQESFNVAWAIARTMSPAPWGKGKRLLPRRVMGKAVPLMIRYVQDELDRELKLEWTK